MLRAQTTENTGDSFTVAFVQDGESWILDRVTETIEGEVGVLMRREMQVAFKKGSPFRGDFSLRGSTAALGAAMADPEVDLVVCTGVLGIEAAFQWAGDLPKPVVGTVLQGTDMVQDYLNDEGLPRRENVSLNLTDRSIADDIEQFRRVVEFDRLHILVNRSVADIRKNTQDVVDRIAQAAGVELILVNFQDTGEATVAQLPPDTEAVYVFPPLLLSNTEIDDLIRSLNVAGYPSFSYSGEEGVQRGMLASAIPDIHDELARRVALNIVNIIGGQEPHQIRSIFPVVPSLSINAATAAQIGLSLSWDRLADARILNRDPRTEDGGQPLAFIQAVTLALQNNFQLRAQRENTEISRLGQDVATSPLLPQASVDYSYSRIDDDSASVGFFPRDAHGVGVTVSQVIFSNDAWANRSVSQRLFEQATLEEQVVQFDVVNKVAQTYLLLLSNLALEKIAQDNLARTRENLDLARVRRRVGSTGPEDVLRFESQEANDQSALASASAQVEIAMTALNRALGVPLDSDWDPEDLNLESPSFDVTAQRLAGLVPDARSWQAFNRFSRERTLESAPEIMAFDQAIEAQTINVDRVRRNFYLPQVGASFNYTYNIDQNFTTSLPIMGRDDQWTLGIQATLPIFEGGQRIHVLNQEKAGLRGLEFQRSLLQQQVEQRTINALDQLEASYPTLQFSRTAEEKAFRNLEVVTDKYREGAVSIIDLLDAQNQYFTAQQNAAVALFRFLSDLVNYQRAIAWFEVLQDPVEKAAWLNDVSAYVGGAGP